MIALVQQWGRISLFANDFITPARKISQRLRRIKTREECFCQRDKRKRSIKGRVYWKEFCKKKHSTRKKQDTTKQKTTWGWVGRSLAQTEQGFLLTSIFVALNWLINLNTTSYFDCNQQLSTSEHEYPKLANLLYRAP